MQTAKLIELLQKLIEEHKIVEDMMGPHEIVIDVFERDGISEHGFHYAGFSQNIRIEKSSDGVYDILNAFAEEK